MAFYHMIGGTAEAPRSARSEKRKNCMGKEMHDERTRATVKICVLGASVVSNYFPVYKTMRVISAVAVSGE